MKNKIRISPRDVKTFEDACLLRASLHQVGNKSAKRRGVETSILTDGLQVWLTHYENGEKEQSIAIEKEQFDRIVDWYIKKQNPQSNQP